MVTALPSKTRLQRAASPLPTTLSRTPTSACGGGPIIIIDKGAIIHVTANYIRQDAISVTRNESAVFLQWWRQKAADLRAPKYTPRGADRRLAAQLVQRHGLDKLKLLGVVFWQNYSTPLIEGEYHQHMVLFQARMAEVQRDLKNIQTTTDL